MTILINQPHPSIDRLVEIFYGRAREDEIIGPIFNRTVKDWDHHLARIS
ncbi:SEC-independent protein translocase TatC, partial [Brucella ceti M644/93/1]